MFHSSLLFSIIIFSFFLFISPAIPQPNTNCSNDNDNCTASSTYRATIITPNCNLGYEIINFFDSAAVSRVSRSTSPPTPPSPLLPLSPPSLSPNTTTNVKEKESKRLKIVIIIVLPVVVVVVVLIVSIFIFLRARKQRDGVASLQVDDTADFETLVFDISTIRTAIDDFSGENYIGQGRFGAVYKGSLVNGQEIAVKFLKKNPMEGESEFKNEVLSMAKLQHRNLVRFLGFCLHKDMMIFVSEFVQNSSLDKFIFEPLKGQDLDWGTRYKIIQGIATGLVYLHQDSQIKVVHRDLKATNILLDAQMNPKISDFFMVKLFQEGPAQENTCLGYMAPEYFVSGMSSKKSDVFSFGVLVIEIVTGQKITSFCEENEGKDIYDLIYYVWRNWRAGTILNVVDPILRGGSSNEIKKCINIGLLCAQVNKANRPTMETVLSHA